MAREFSTVGVVGLGTMGAGIAEVFARHGLAVVAVEREAALQAGRRHVEDSAGRAVRRGKLSEADQERLLAAIAFGTDLNSLDDCELVVEAVPEHLDLKRELFARLDKIVGPDTILATNTSSLSVTEISVATERPGRVVMHFFNPAPIQELIEVVHTVVTEPAVVDDVTALAVGWARRQWCALTGPASSPTRCCSDISIAPWRCTRPVTRPARTSTTRCGSPADIRWGRWPCSI